ncbi:PH domain-containing protein [Nocardioides jejuensis]|uniref:PH domain-containing protein n=1 Tax=Nocardioides jejuensis TaxID=2502782 RepID=A0A4R1BTT8_9ACTN|nr:PH domain-containing protein [Nocardioides jejuensis]TCJ21303.1 PH domain-containing protein [Nocardioides jejuensis]
MSPSADGVTLPKTWRPFGVRAAGGIFGLALIIILIAAWISFPASVKEQFNMWQRVTTVVLFGGFLAVEWGLMRCRATATAAGLTVVNGYKVRQFEWAQIVAARMPVGAPWLTLDLDDGTTCAVMAIQGSDGLRAKRACADLKSLIG